MGRRIDRQPDGRFAVWSTIVDAYIMTDATPEEITEMYVETYRASITEDVKRQVERADNVKL